MHFSYHNQKLNLVYANNSRWGTTIENTVKQKILILFLAIALIVIYISNKMYEEAMQPSSDYWEINTGCLKQSSGKLHNFEGHTSYLLWKTFLNLSVWLFPHLEDILILFVWWNSLVNIHISKWIAIQVCMFLLICFSFFLIHNILYNAKRRVGFLSFLFCGVFCYLANFAFCPTPFRWTNININAIGRLLAVERVVQYRPPFPVW